LRYAGVHIIDPHDGSSTSLAPIASGTGSEIADNFQWAWVLQAFGRSYGENDA
jgi:hypothetical protein